MDDWLLRRGAAGRGRGVSLEGGHCRGQDMKVRWVSPGAE